MNYFKKNKKYSFMIIFCIFSFFFIDNAYALTNKGYGQVNWTTANTHSATIVGDGNDNYVFRFDGLSNPNNYDFIGFRADPLFGTQNYINNLDTTWCNEWTAVTQQLTSGSDVEYRLQRMYCSHQYGTSPSVNPSIKEGKVGFSAFIGGGQTASEPCFYTQEYEGILLCPLKDGRNFLSFYGNNYGNDSMYYEISISNMVLYYNSDTSEIVNALGGVQTQQLNTIDAIQQQTQQQAQQNAYVQNSNISQAQTNTSDNITLLNDQLTQELSQFSDLTQLVVAPITLFMELNNNVCAPLTLQIPFVNQTAVLPCIKPIMQQYFGGMYSVFTTVIGAILCYWTFVRTVALIKELVDADNDKIEVVDL